MFTILIIKMKRSSNVSTEEMIFSKQSCPQELGVDKYSKAVIQKSSVKKVINRTAMKLRLRGTPAINVDNETKILSPYKLGSHVEDSSNCLPMSLYQCPICLESFTNINHRQLHEKKNHLSPPACSPVNSDGLLENTLDNEKLEFLFYLNLARTSKKVSNKNDIAYQLAKRKHFLNACQSLGNEIGLHKCKFCMYKTSRMFILWAHIFINHDIKSDSDSKSNSYCFICERVLTKRSQLLRHIEKCVVKQGHEERDSEDINCALKTSLVKKYTCDICKADFDSLSVLENHLWNHNGL